MKGMILLSAALLLLLINLSLKAQEENNWWNSSDWQKYNKDPLAKTLPRISVVGNKFINEKGETVLFRGVAISDPEWYPSLFKSFDNYELTEPGEFFKKAMHGKVQK